jgi:pimeloyl-ACP methyl ester carboxylesterase
LWPLVAVSEESQVIAPSIYKSPEGERAVMALYDVALARWTLAHRDLVVPTCQGETFVIAAGKAEGAAVVLLHGAGSNALAWGADIGAYAESYRVFAVDLIGEPGRSAPSRPSWEGDAFAGWLSDVLDGLGIERAALVGLSQGAWAALKFAVARPDRVSTLALLSPGGIAPDRLSFLMRAVLLSPFGRRGAERMIDMVMGGRPLDPETRRALATITTHFKPRIGALPLFTDQELRRLTMPVLLLMGSRDALRDADRIVARLQPLLPRLTTTIIPEGGHALVDTTAHVLPFLATAVHG